MPNLSWVYEMVEDLEYGSCRAFWARGLYTAKALGDSLQKLFARAPLGWLGGRLPLIVIDSPDKDRKLGAKVDCKA